VLDKVRIQNQRNFIEARQTDHVRSLFGEASNLLIGQAVAGMSLKIG
jgi:hypothetical protein